MGSWRGLRRITGRRLILAATANDQTLMATPAAYLPASKLPAITAAVLAAVRCGGWVEGWRGGESSGVPVRSRRCWLVQGGGDGCVFDGGAGGYAEVDLCGEGGCDGKDGLPGYEPGAEECAGELGGLDGRDRSRAIEPAMMYFGLGYFNGLCVWERETWTLGTFDFDRDSKLALDEDGRGVECYGYRI